MAKQAANKKQTKTRDKAQNSTVKKSAATPKGAAAVEPPATRKKTLAALALAAVAIAVVIALAMNAGGFAKMTVERIASKSLGVPVTMATLEISLQEKQIVVGGLDIGNPDGFSGGSAVTAERIVIAADQIGRDLLVFDKINVTGAALNLEVTQDGTNFTRLRDQAQGNAKTASVGDPAEAAPSAGREEVRVIIRELGIEQASLHPKIGQAGNVPESISLPPVRIRNIGVEQEGVPPAVAIAQIVQYVTQVAMKSSLQQGYLGALDSERLEALQAEYGIAPGLIDRVKNLFGDLAP